MKVTVENKKGLNKDLKVFVDKKTMNSYLEEKSSPNLKLVDIDKIIASVSVDNSLDL